jgi:hypothetical protein
MSTIKTAVRIRPFLQS